MQYYIKMLTSPFGQKVKTFYTNTSKQVLDIHEEARRLADEQKVAAATAGGSASTTAPTTTPGPATQAGSGKAPDLSTQAAPVV